MFEQVRIKLVHGWVVDPDSEEANAVGKTADYDSAVNRIADADHTTNGHLLHCEDSFGAGSHTRKHLLNISSKELQSKAQSRCQHTEWMLISDPHRRKC